MKIEQQVIAVENEVSVEVLGESHPSKNMKELNPTPLFTLGTIMCGYNVEITPEC